MSKKKKNQQFNTIGRISIVSPKDSERFMLQTVTFYVKLVLKLILHKIKGVTCFKDLLTLDKIFYKTYKGAALALGFIEDDEHIYKVFEVCKIMLPHQLRKFFLCFLLAENIQGIFIWEKFQTIFSEDYKINKEIAALKNI